MFEDFLDAVASTDFEEVPVPLEEFLYAKEFLAFPPLSPVQETMVEAMSNIYKHETNVELWGEEKADEIARYSKKEIILQVGKGSGKDAMSAIAMTRAAYLLLCLKDPAKYFGKPSGDAIYLINVAVNAKQAKNVYFRGNLLQRVKSCAWFEGKYTNTADTIQFDKNVMALSGNSESEAWEGYNILMAVLDEISAFETETTATAGERKKTADNIYDMYKQSIASRFPEYGKLALLSFPRHKECFISKRYNEVVQDKETYLRQHTFHIHKDRPIEEVGNSMTIEWEEDHIIRYREPNVVAFKLPSWEVNPTVSLEGLMDQFLRDEKDSLKRFACMPPEVVDGYFTNRAVLEEAFPPNVASPFLPDWSIRPGVRPNPEKNYYGHVDLAFNRDRASVAMASVQGWREVVHGDYKEVRPELSIDLVRIWSPTKSNELELDDVLTYITGLREKGYNLKLVTYDFWNSLSHRQVLTRDYGIKTDKLSVQVEQYNEFTTALTDGRVFGYNLPLMVNEYMQLQLIRGKKIDHTSKSSKDVADSVVGAAYNATQGETYRKGDKMVRTRYRFREDEDKKAKEVENKLEEAPPQMPKNLKAFFHIV